MAIEQSSLRNKKLKCQNYSKVSGTLDLPNLVAIQTDSYKDFVERGIDEVFRDIYPIYSPNKLLELSYVRCWFEEPKKTIDDCKERDLTYSVPLKVELRLTKIDKDTGERIVLGEKQEDKVKKDKKDSDLEGVFMGDFPKMTPSGTFVINGAERVIVSQIVRSPGAYYGKEKDKTGKNLYSGEVIPTRGTWIQYETDAKEIMYVRVDRTRKVPATVLLRALGVSDEIMKNLFGDNPFLKNTLAKDSTHSVVDAMLEIHSKVRQGEKTNEEGARTVIKQKFFDPRRYDLGRAGRFKFRRKLGLYNRLVNHYLAEPLADVNGEVIFNKGDFIDEEKIRQLKELGVFELGACAYSLGDDITLDDANTVQMIRVYRNAEMTEDNISIIVGTDLRIDKKHITVPDIVASFSYFLNLTEGIGDVDDIDHLGNRRIRTIGELLQNQFRIGLSRMERTVSDKMSTTETSTLTPKNLTNIRPLTAAIKEFFSSSQLSQFMDQTNPLAELTNKRRISALGIGGLSRERAAMAVRDVHDSHYGRICPIETPEGPNIGLINNLSSYARIDCYGFIETPYRRVKKVHTTDANGQEIIEYVVLDGEKGVDYLSADDENNFVIAQANIKLNYYAKDEPGAQPLTEEEIKQDNAKINQGLPSRVVKKVIAEQKVIARRRGETTIVDKEEVNYIDVSPKQIVSVAAACIPFLENDDAKRALMGANMQRQAIPLLQPQCPYVGTGMEARIAQDSGSAVLCSEAGTVKYVDALRISVENDEGLVKDYKLHKFVRSNQGTCINTRPIVEIGQRVKANEIIADGPGMENGELALGQNVTVAFMTWQGYNYEDAVIMSERMVKDDVYTSIHIVKYDIECRDTKLGPEEITRDISNVSNESKAHLDARGIVVPGSEVKEGDILVGKITPKGQTEPSPEEKLLMAIFGEKIKDGKDNSLRVPHGGAGIVLDVEVFSRNDKDGEDLAPEVNEAVHVYVAQKRKIAEGDKMAGRHGNKGVISKIVPIEDMPYMEDGTPIDIMLNPQGVPSRMNIGQVLELHLGMAAKKLGMRVATPVFDGVTNQELTELMAKAEMDPDGKKVLYDGRTGEQFEQRIAVGVMYMIKLSHMVDDKIHARSTGPYSLVTQQPLGGKAQNGGQRFGEMEVWALEAYGAAHTLQEILTIKSDDMLGRAETYKAIIDGQPIPQPGMPEAFRVLQKELQALSIDVELQDKDGNELSTKDMVKQNEMAVRTINASFRDSASEFKIDLGAGSDDE